MLKRLTIRGFKSIRTLEDFELRNLNVLIGANGAGKPATGRSPHDGGTRACAARPPHVGVCFTDRHFLSTYGDSAGTGRSTCRLTCSR